MKFDPIHTNIPISELEECIINSGLFNRLQYIMQTSTSYFTFPSLKHSRYSHSIGVMHLSGKMFCSIVRNSEKKTIDILFDKIENIINNYILKISNLDIHGADGDRNIREILERYKRLNKQEYQFHDLSESSFSIIENNNFDIFKYADGQKRKIYYVILEALRLVGALHDVGHMPFSHLFEDVLKEMYGDLIDKKERTENEEKLYNFLHKILSPKDCQRGESNRTVKEKELSRLCQESNIDEEQRDYLNRLKQPLPPHEYMGEIITYLIFNEQIVAGKFNDQDQKILIHIIKKLAEMIYAEIKIEEFDFRVLHQIIDGPIDADRLDYIPRDISHSGLNLLSFDIDRIVRSVKYNEEFMLTFPSLILSDIENFFVSRYESYNEIIFHHKVVRTNKILEEVLKQQINEILENSDSTILNESSDYVLNSKIEGFFEALQAIDSNNQFDTTKRSLVNQFEENWLLRMLKIIRFTLEAKDNMRSSKENFLLDCLKDVLDGEERFITLWENKEIFRNDIYRQISRLYPELSKDEFRDFFHNFVSIEALENFEPNIMSKIIKLNREVEDNKKILFYIRKFSLGTSGINRICIDFDGELKALSDVSQIEDRLRVRVSENLQILFFSNLEENQDIRNKILEEIAIEIVNYYWSIGVVYGIVYNEEWVEELYETSKVMRRARALVKKNVDEERWDPDNVELVMGLSRIGRFVLKNEPGLLQSLKGE